MYDTYSWLHKGQPAQKRDRHRGYGPTGVSEEWDEVKVVRVGCLVECVWGCVRAWGVGVVCEWVGVCGQWTGLNHVF
jgi:hypothetical protein